MCEKTFSASFVPQPAENNTYLHKTFHGTDYIPSCIAVLLSISFIRWSEPSMVKPGSFVFDVLQHAKVIYHLVYINLKEWKKL